MSNSAIYGLFGLLVLFFISSIIIWLVGRRKNNVLTEELKALYEEKRTINEKVSVLSEKCTRIGPLEQEVSKVRSKMEDLQAENSRLSSSFAAELEKNKNSQIKNKELQGKIEELSREIAAEVEKNKKMKMVSDELTQKNAVLAELQEAAGQDKASISALNSQLQEERNKAEEQAAVLNSLKRLWGR